MKDSATPNLPETEARIAELLEALARPAPVRARAEELVNLLMGLYGEGLARIVGMLGPADLARLAQDSLLGSLLILHDLHPLTAAERVERALRQVQQQSGASAGGAELIGIDAQGVARVRLTGSGTGCGCSAAATRDGIEQAVLDAAPEVSRVEVQDPPKSAPVLLQIGHGPGRDARL